ncbi:carbohydrate-binding protein [Streptomyces chartreusis]|uniref:hypothetical protein n=1 Tax=Streptomyces chartreusis TaxID=1969 RepID=UPI0036530C12
MPSRWKKAPGGSAAARGLRTPTASGSSHITMGDAEPVKVTFKNTWSPDDYWTVSVPVELKERANRVTFGNATAWEPRIDRIQLGRVVGLL